MNSFPTLRVARPSDDLEALLRFYRDGLGAWADPDPPPYRRTTQVTRAEAKAHE